MVERRLSSCLLLHRNGDCRREYRMCRDFVSCNSIGEGHLDSCRRGQESSPQLAKGYSRSLHSYPSVRAVSHPPLRCTDHQGRFYILGVTIIGLLVPSNSEGLNLTEKTAAASPFVLAIKTAGIKGLPSVINACLLTSGAYMLL